MGRMSAGALVALTVTLSTGAQVAAAPQASSELLRVHVNLVNVPVNVTDRHGRPV